MNTTYQFVKATSDNIPDHNDFIFVRVDREFNTIMKPNTLADSIERYPNSTYEIQQETPLPEYKEITNDELKQRFVNALHDPIEFLDAIDECVEIAEEYANQKNTQQLSDAWDAGKEREFEECMNRNENDHIYQYPDKETYLQSQLNK